MIVIIMEYVKMESVIVIKVFSDQIADHVMIEKVKKFVNN